MSKVDEERVKAILLERLRRDSRITSDAILASEFSLAYEGVRADLAIFGSEFVGIEIKSELDSLKRLSNQVATYERFFDRVVVVLATRHFTTDVWKIVGGAEVWEVTRRGALRKRRAAKSKAVPEASQLEVLLTKSERQNATIRRHLSIGAEGLSPEQRQEAFRAAFKIAVEGRFGRTSRTFWEAVDGREVTAMDLRTLERFTITLHRTRRQRSSCRTRRV